MKEQVDRLNKLAMTPIINIIYSVSPRHSDEYFVRKASEAAALNPYRLCFKDVGGLLTPERIRQLIPKVMAASPGVTWEFHGHCNNSFGPINALEVAKLGIEVIHTAVPPLANANSQPSIYNVAANLRALGFDARIDEEALRPASGYFEFIAKREKFQIGMPYEYDHKLYSHQVPGGMISNLKYQLSLAGVADRIGEVLEEIPLVRAELGYPIMVTPLSQIVGTQAAINVIVGERYRQVTDATIEYALGRHGREAPDVMDQDVRDKILNRPRAAEIGMLEPWEPTIAELRQRYGKDISDEDLILLAVVGDDALDVVGSAATLRHHLTSNRPLSELIYELATRDNHRFVSIKKDGLSLVMVKSK
ncbi:MAG: biotin carboxyl carrier protein [Acidimicrobiaceae bacterium]|nr:biotin carboxyl carrier protein [Acidimicrobiaceae bacterium]